MFILLLYSYIIINSYRYRGKCFIWSRYSGFWFCRFIKIGPFFYGYGLGIWLEVLDLFRPSLQKYLHYYIEKHTVCLYYYYILILLLTHIDIEESVLFGLGIVVFGFVGLLKLDPFFMVMV